MSKLANVLIGVFLIVIGTILGLNILEITNINIFFKGWWTLFIIIPSLVGLINNKDKEGNLIGLIVGVLLFILVRFDLDTATVFKLVIPSILILFGISFINKSFSSKVINGKEKGKKEILGNLKEYNYLFSSEKLSFSGDTFKGGELNVTFAELKIDLTGLDSNEDIYINANCTFGNIILVKPKGMNIDVVSKNIFGSVNNKVVEENKPGNKTIFLNCSNMFGGVDIK